MIYLIAQGYLLGGKLAKVAVMDCLRRELRLQNTRTPIRCLEIPNLLNRNNHNNHNFPNGNYKPLRLYDNLHTPVRTNLGIKLSQHHRYHHNQYSRHRRPSHSHNHGYGQTMAKSQTNSLLA